MGFKSPIKIKDKVIVIQRAIVVVWSCCMFTIATYLSSESTEIILLGVVFTIAFTCPCLWSVIRYVREYSERRKVVVIPQKKVKKADIAQAKAVNKPKTQAEILAEQRKNAKKIHGVVKKSDKKGDKKKTPKRKSRPNFHSNIKLPEWDEWNDHATMAVQKPAGAKIESFESLRDELKLFQRRLETKVEKKRKKSNRIRKMSIGFQTEQPERMDSRMSKLEKSIVELQIQKENVELDRQNVEKCQMEQEMKWKSREVNAYLQWLHEQVVRIGAVVGQHDVMVKKDIHQEEKVDLHFVFQLLELGESSFILRPNVPYFDQHGIELGYIEKIELAIAKLVCNMRQGYRKMNANQQDVLDKQQQVALENRQKYLEDITNNVAKERKELKAEFELQKSKMECAMHEDNEKHSLEIHQLQLSNKVLQEQLVAQSTAHELQEKNALQQVKHDEFRLRTTFERQDYERNTKHTLEMTKMEEKVKRVVAEHQASKKRMEIENDRLTASMEELETQLKSIRQKMDRQLNQHQTIIERKTKSHSQEVDHLRKEHESALQAIRIQTKKLASDHRTYIQNLKAQHEREMEATKTHCTMLIEESRKTNLKQQVANRTTKHRMTMSHSNLRQDRSKCVIEKPGQNLSTRLSKAKCNSKILSAPMQVPIPFGQDKNRENNNHSHNNPAYAR